MKVWRNVIALSVSENLRAGNFVWMRSSFFGVTTAIHCDYTFLSYQGHYSHMKLPQPFDVISLCLLALGLFFWKANHTILQSFYLIVNLWFLLSLRLIDLIAYPNYQSLAMHYNYFYLQVQAVAGMMNESGNSLNNNRILMPPT